MNEASHHLDDLAHHPTFLDDPVAYERMSLAVNPYGDGKACSRIVRALKGGGSRAVRGAEEVRGLSALISRGPGME